MANHNPSLQKYQLLLKAGSNLKMKCENKNHTWVLSVMTSDEFFSLSKSIRWRLFDIFQQSFLNSKTKTDKTQVQWASSSTGRRFWEFLWCELLKISPCHCRVRIYAYFIKLWMLLQADGMKFSKEFCLNKIHCPTKNYSTSCDLEVISRYDKAGKVSENSK